MKNEVNDTPENNELNDISKNNDLKKNTSLLLVIVLLTIIIGILSFQLGKKTSTVNFGESKEISKVESIVKKPIAEDIKVNEENLTTTNEKTKPIESTTVGGNTNTEEVSTTDNETPKTEEVKVDASNITIKAIGDKRCTNCPTNEIISGLKQVPFLSGATFEEKDFSDEGIEKYLKDNEITKLPAFIFSTNEIIDPQGQMKQYLTQIKNGEYSLNVGANFDPFAKRSEKGFLILDSNKLKEIKEDSYIKGNKDTKITWIEFSDLECPYCARLHNSGTQKEIKEKYKDKINIAYNHFPLDFHKNAKVGSEILECVGELSGTDNFYKLIEIVFKEKKSDKSFIIDKAVELGLDKVKLEKCVNSGKYSAKIDKQLDRGNKLFGITGTPGNVLVNNETLEYDVISGAYPTQSFVDIIDKLLK